MFLIPNFYYMVNHMINDKIKLYFIQSKEWMNRPNVTELNKDVFVSFWAQFYLLKSQLDKNGGKFQSLRLFLVNYHQEKNLQKM